MTQMWSAEERDEDFSDWFDAHYNRLMDEQIRFSRKCYHCGEELDDKHSCGAYWRYLKFLHRHET